MYNHPPLGRIQIVVDQVLLFSKEKGSVSTYMHTHIHTYIHRNSDFLVVTISVGLAQARPNLKFRVFIHNIEAVDNTIYSKSIVLYSSKLHR